MKRHHSYCSNKALFDIISTHTAQTFRFALAGILFALFLSYPVYLLSMMYSVSSCCILLFNFKTITDYMVNIFKYSCIKGISNVLFEGLHIYIECCIMLSSLITISIFPNDKCVSF